jgi:hypothetical protein
MTEKQATRPSKTSVKLFTVDPDEILDAVVRYWWTRQQWRAPIEDYRKMWNWRYSSLSDGRPLVCVARDMESGELAGHIALYRRTFSINGVLVRVGVPGSLALRADLQGGFTGANLASFPHRQLRAGVFDALLAFANPIAQDLFTRLGGRDLGAMSRQVDLYDSTHFSQTHLPAARPLAPALNLGLAIRRRLRRFGAERQARAFDARPIDAAEFRALDRSHWNAPRDRLVAADSTEFVIRRHLECPYAARTMYGVFDRGTSRLQGYVITEGTEAVTVWDCQFNADCLDVATTLTAASHEVRNAMMLVVSTMPRTHLAEELRRAGFVTRTPVDGASIGRLLSVSLPQAGPLNPLVNDFAAWNVWLAASQI